MRAQNVLESTYSALLDALTDADPAQAYRATRCRGWARVDLLHHLLSDAQRALVALHTPAGGAADTDEVSYWRSFPAGDDGDAEMRHTRSMASLWSFPVLAERYTETAHAVVVASNERAGTDRVSTQGHILTVDALRSTLAVEATVHHLDLGLEHPSLRGLAEVRRVLDGLLGHPAAITDDVRYALVGTGREPLSAAEREQLGQAAERLPLFG
jgi:hypothetical protein